jgi:predicted dehydrogenase
MSIKRILFIGLGGAGQRQLRVLRSLLSDEVEYATFRACGKTPLLTPDFKVVENETIEDHYGLKEYRSLEEAFDAQPDIAVIANPTSLHVPTALAAASRGIDVFIEKPLGDSLVDLEKLEASCREHQSTCYVAYQRRFHPSYVTAKRLVQQGVLGEIVVASFETLSFVPQWHPYEDYRRLYAVRKDLGGGVLLTESHELDLCAQLFGLPQEVFCAGGALMCQELDVEDTVSLILSYRNRARPLTVRMFLSFMQPDTRRAWSITGTKGHLSWCEQENTLQHHDYESGKTNIFPGNILDRDRLFVDQAQFYLQWLAENSSTETGLEDGKASLLMAMAARRSIASGKPEAID